MPIVRRTRAPLPSDCSMARKTWRIARGIDMFAGLWDAKKKGGTKGRVERREWDEFERLLDDRKRDVKGVR